jgi:hypothetical protein
MSRSNDIPKSDGMTLDNSPVASERQHESARGATSREAAHREMDRFRGPDEYNVRKLTGQRAARQHQIGVPVNENSEVSS